MNAADHQETERETPLSENHVRRGAKMVPFAGWRMPVQYPEGIIREHLQTREKASLFDICHMGEFRIRGTGSAEALDHALARPVVDQKPGSCRYNFLLAEDGTVIDDLLVYRLSPDEFYLVVNAATTQTDASVLQERLPGGVSFADESDRTAKLDLQGPSTAAVLERLGMTRNRIPKFYHWFQTQIDSIPCLASRTGYTGELGVELYFPWEKAEIIWDRLLEDKEVKPAGLGARDTLRLEMGLALYGHELNRSTTPVDAGYAAMLKLDSPRNFVGSAALRSKPREKILLALELEGRQAAREGTPVLAGTSRIGTVTSGAFAPSLGKAIALAYTEIAQTPKVGETVGLDAGRKTLSATVVELPFYRRGTARMNLEATDPE
jgi:aminomethyltransferase